MGYCYTTGKKENGRWHFLKCDGRSAICAQHGTAPPGNVPADGKKYTCSQCVEWCKTRREAIDAVKECDRLHAIL